MLAINDIRAGTYITYQGEPFVVLKHDFVKMGRGKGVMRVSIKNLKTGKILEESFKGNDKVEEADIARSRANYLYQEGNQYFFMDAHTYDQFFITAEQLGGQVDYLYENIEVSVLLYNDEPIGIELPKKIELEVIQAPPGVRGDTAQGSVTKKATLTNGLVVDVPLFIDIGDTVIVNTETGKYVGKQ